MLTTDYSSSKKLVSGATETVSAACFTSRLRLKPVTANGHSVSRGCKLLVAMQVGVSAERKPAKPGKLLTRRPAPISRLLTGDASGHVAEAMADLCCPAHHMTFPEALR